MRSPGDLDGDGSLDLASGGPDAVALHQGGSGGFVTTILDDTGDGRVPYRDVALLDADGDGDGDDDLVLEDLPPDGTRALFVRENLGEARFGPAQTLATYVLVDGITVGDADSNGTADLVLSGESGLVYLGDGVGGFAPVANAPAFSGGDAEVADIDGDGHSDLLVATLENPDGASIEVHRGTARGLVPPTTVVADPGRQQAYTLVVADVDDGVADVVTAGSVVDVFPNRLDGARSHG